jgi:hypothetical protein
LKTWQKAGVNALGGAIVGATGGLGGTLGFGAVATTITGSVATAFTSFGVSLAEDKIEGRELDYSAAAASSLLATATFGFSKYGLDKITKNVRGGFWNRGYNDPFNNYTKGNTNAFVRYLGKNPNLHVAQIGDRITDLFGLGLDVVYNFLYRRVHNDNSSEYVRQCFVIAQPIVNSTFIDDDNEE